MFSLLVDIKDVINVPRSVGTIKSAANILRQSLFSVDFGLKDKFCDAEELKYAWRNTKVPDEFMTLFSELFNIKKTALLKKIIMKILMNKKPKKGQKMNTMRELHQSQRN